MSGEGGNVKQKGLKKTKNCRKTGWLRGSVHDAGAEMPGNQKSWFRKDEPERIYQTGVGAERCVADCRSNRVRGRLGITGFTNTSLQVQGRLYISRQSAKKDSLFRCRLCDKMKSVLISRLRHNTCCESKRLETTLSLHGSKTSPSCLAYS